MPTRGFRGFSLVELLFALMVMGLITGIALVALTFGGQKQEVREQLEYLSALAVYAIDEAQFSGADLGLLVVETQADNGASLFELHWRQRLPDGWEQPANSGELFASIRFPEDVELQLTLDGEAIDLAADGEQAVQGDAISEPQWLFLASGETQPGELVAWSDADSRLYLSWDALARFSRVSDEPIPSDEIEP
ncbi:MAG: prepilin-type N-terminal cleavage/methylation domain-containing protein [Pseudomonadota bacterium]